MYKAADVLECVKRFKMIDSDLFETWLNLSSSLHTLALARLIKQFRRKICSRNIVIKSELAH